MTGSKRPLCVFFPGSCAQLIPELQTEFAKARGGGELVAGKIDQTGHLATDILAGGAADVMMSANIAYLEQVRDGGLVHQIHPFARNSLCLLVRKERVKDIQTVQAVRRADVRTLVCPPETDPCGQYTVEMFERAGLTEIVAEQK